MDRPRQPAPTRRHALGLGLGLAATTAGLLRPDGARAARPPAVATDPARLEQQYAVTLGLVARNLTTGASLEHRPDTRFPMLSTFKTLAVAAVLDRHDRHDRGRDLLDRRLRITADEVVVNSPICSQRREMTVAELCDAALRYSDNTAGNKLLGLVGGPPGLTRYARSLGDRVTRLDRWEPTLNDAVPGDPRDTSTPAALAADYEKLLLGRALDVRDRWLLRTWLQGSTTSGTRFRAGVPTAPAVPTTWTLADKTGAGAYATLNDVGVVVAPDGTTLVIAATSRTEDPTRVADNALMRDVAALVVDRLT